MQKTCKQCSAGFEITAEDLKFYEKIEVPQPLMCPGCRAIERLSWRNERRFYVGQSALSGKRIISVISPDKPFDVYEVEE